MQPLSTSIEEVSCYRSHMPQFAKSLGNADDSIQGNLLHCKLQKLVAALRHEEADQDMRQQAGKWSSTCRQPLSVPN